MAFTFLSLRDKYKTTVFQCPEDDPNTSNETSTKVNITSCVLFVPYKAGNSQLRNFILKNR